MKQLHLTTILAAVALSFTACSSDDSLDGALSSSSNKVAAVVTADIDNGQASSRVASIDATSFEKGDVINVVATQNGTATNHQYSKPEEGTSWTAVSAYFFQNDQSVSFVGWYSSLTTLQTLTETNNTVDTSAQTTTTDGWNSCDILVTPAVTATQSSPSVSFTNGSSDNRFQHKMSKVTFTFKAGTTSGIADLTDLSAYKLDGMYTTANFNTKTCVIAVNETTKGGITQSVTGSAETSITATPIIVVPQTVSSGGLTIEVTYDNTTYKATLNSTDAFTFEAGKHYTFEVTLNGTSLSVTNTTDEIAAWTDANNNTSVDASISSGE